MTNPAPRPTKGDETKLRRLAHGERAPVTMVPGRSPPTLTGKTGYHTTKNGNTIVHNPHAYGHPTTYHPSTRRVECGIEWFFRWKKLKAPPSWTDRKRLRGAARRRAHPPPLPKSTVPPSANESLRAWMARTPGPHFIDVQGRKAVSSNVLAWALETSPWRSSPRLERILDALRFLNAGNAQAFDTVVQTSYMNCLITDADVAALRLCFQRARLGQEVAYANGDTARRVVAAIRPFTTNCESQPAGSPGTI